MAITFQTSSSDTGTANSNTVTVTAPSGIQDGDLLVAVIMSDTGDGADGTWTPPSGWTEDVHEFSNYDGALVGIFHKIASGESGNYTWTMSNATGAGGVIGMILRYSGAHPTSPINQTGKTKGINGATSPWVESAPSITPTVDNCLILWVGFADDNGGGSVTMTVPAGYSTRLGVQGATGAVYSHINVGELQQTSATATGTQTCNWTETSQAACAIAAHVAIAPALSVARNLIRRNRPRSFRP